MDKAETLYSALAAKAAELNRPLKRLEWLGEARKILGSSMSKDERNELIEALVRECGGDPANTTKPALRAAAVAMNDIRAVCPTLTAQDIKERAALYRRRHPTWPLTPSALAKNWGSLGGTRPTQSESLNIYAEPQGWKPVFARIYNIDVANLDNKAWTEISPDMRMTTLQRMKA